MDRVLPILFNGDMVRAILDGRKTVTRRSVKQPMWENFVCEGGEVVNWLNKKSDVLENPVHKAPYQVGDILYVREAYCIVGKDVDKVYFENGGDMWDGMYLYKADRIDMSDIGKWHPSIHMPKQAARIWLKVTDVRVERLQDIGLDDCRREGIDMSRSGIYIRFSMLWDSTVKKSDISLYGWDADPWVWVIEFERCEPPEVEDA